PQFRRISADFGGFCRTWDQGAAQGATVADVMLIEVPTLMLTEPLERALDALHQPNTPAVAVTDRKDLFLGYITRENIGEWVVLSSRPRKT
ncbi:MAG: hypothetical protein NWQ37_08045, partial [Marivita lacus]|nr:hypothetical protein [Marivita lacus]